MKSPWCCCEHDCLYLGILHVIKHHFDETSIVLLVIMVKLTNSIICDDRHVQTGWEREV